MISKAFCAHSGAPNSLAPSPRKPAAIDLGKVANFDPGKATAEGACCKPLRIDF